MQFIGISSFHLGQSLYSGQAAKCSGCLVRAPPQRICAPPMRVCAPPLRVPAPPLRVPALKWGQIRALGELF